MTATAAPVRPATSTPAADELQRIPLTDLHESPWNPRQRFDEAKLAELAESLRTQGQLAPVVVRPRAGGGYELGAGHRRFRAAAKAGLKTLLAIVRPLEDVAFLELLVFENGNRNDLHALEEAEGYRRLMEQAGYDVSKIAVRDGRSTKYVYDRIKLLQLIPEAKKMFLAGMFEAGHAIILARLPIDWQKQAIDTRDSRYTGGNGHIGGLFYPERFDPDPNLPAQEQLRLEDAVKPVTVREFQSWVDDHVRFTPAAADPMLFPETAQVLAEADAEDEKVVHITHDYRVPDAARDDKQRTYGEASWKRADGRHKSKVCEHAVLGVVVAGPGRGDAFKVCVERKKCRTHWPAPRKTRSGGRSAAATAADWQARHRAFRADRERAERARWWKARPVLLKMLAEKVAAAPAGATSALAKIVVDECTGHRNRDAAKLLPRGRTVEDLIRHCAFLSLAGDISNEWAITQDAPRTLKAFGLDAKKIVDEAAPPPAPEKKPTKAPAKKKATR